MEMANTNPWGKHIDWRFQRSWATMISRLMRMVSNQITLLTNLLLLFIFRMRMAWTRKFKWMTRTTIYMTMNWKWNPFCKLLWARHSNMHKLKQLKITKQRNSDHIKGSSSRWKKQNSWSHREWKQHASVVLRNRIAEIYNNEQPRIRDNGQKRKFLRELWQKTSWWCSREIHSKL